MFLKFSSEKRMLRIDSDSPAIGYNEKRQIVCHFEARMRINTEALALLPGLLSEKLPRQLLLCEFFGGIPHDRFATLVHDRRKRLFVHIKLWRTAINGLDREGDFILHQLPGSR